MVLHGRPVPTHVWPGGGEPVFHRPAHQREECFRGRARRAEDVGRRLVECDEEAGRDGRARVVERTRGVGQHERLKAEEAGGREARLERFVGLCAHSGPRAVELLGPARERERLERMDGEAPLMRLKRRERARAAGVRDPGPDRELGGHVRHGAVGHAEQDELGVAAGEVAACDRGREALGELGRYGTADAAGADDACGSDVHSRSSSRGIPGANESSGLALGRVCVFGLELERRGVDAVPKPRGVRAVGEEVPEMAFAARAEHFRAPHEP